MGALPKERISSARQGKRRAHHALTLPSLVSCSQCHQPKISHHACPTCGTYRGRDILLLGRNKRKRASEE